MSKSLKFALCLVLGGAASAAGAGEKPLGLGRPALPAEIKAWDIDVRPDGQGLPAGKGSVAAGETLFLERCAVCHGEFGEGAGRWPPLAGGSGSLTSDHPDKPSAPSGPICRRSTTTSTAPCPSATRSR